jgi:hypothetical protein
MNANFNNQLFADFQEYIKLKYRQMQLRSIEQSSALIGMIVAYLLMIVVVIIGLIFMAIALAAWLEFWLPMWASYLIIAGVMLLIAGIIFGGRKLWFVHPMEKQLTKRVLNDANSISIQKQTIENQLDVQRKLLERDVAEVQNDWTKVQRIATFLRDLLSSK